MKRSLPAKGTTVKLVYLPAPFLGRGIVEEVEVEGVICDPKEVHGKTYVVLKDAIGGNLIIERELGDIISLTVVEGTPVQRVAPRPVEPVHQHTTPQQEVPTQTRRSSYNRV